MILDVIGKAHQVQASQVIHALFAERYSNRDDYFKALQQVWGPDVSQAAIQAVAEAEAEVTARRSERGRVGRFFVGGTSRSWQYALLLQMPEPDFRLAVEVTPTRRFRRSKAAREIAEVCRSRGIPWTFKTGVGFTWIGDEVIEEQLLRPANSVLADQRFAGGVLSEFNSALGELHTGAPVARKQAIYEAANAVESALKVILDERGVNYGPRDTAQPLFEHLVAAELVPRSMERFVLAAAQMRNSTAGHGAGANPHDVTVAQAEAAVAASAGAIAFLGRLLP